MMGGGGGGSGAGGGGDGGDGYADDRGCNLNLKKPSIRAVWSACNLQRFRYCSNVRILTKPMQLWLQVSFDDILVR